MARPGRLGLLCMAVFAASCAQQCGGAPPPAPTPTAPTTVNDVIVTFPGLTGHERPMVLYSGARAGACRKYEPHVGTTSPSVTLSAVAYDASCPVEIDVFAPSHGAYGRVLLTNPPADVLWWEGVITAGTMPITLGGDTPIPVNIWIASSNVADQSSAMAVYTRQELAAGPILDALGPGFSVSATLHHLASSSVSPDCAAAAAIASNPEIYAAHSVNVYYVKEYMNAPFANYGQNCWMQGHPEIVFVSWGDPYNPDPVLAHELGHALGLFHPATATIGGHTNGIAGFDGKNLMSTGAPTVRNASVGQSYAMNFSTDSWLNSTGSLMPRPVSRACQDAWGAGLCPDLTMFLSGWPVP